MRSAIVCSLGWMMCIVALGQVARSPGTPQESILRGEAAYLRGMAWYEVGTARATSINADTTIRWNREVRRVWREQAAWKSSLEAKKKAGQQAKVAEIRRQQIEHEIQLRTRPTPEDVVKGDALNALLVDLCNPTIPIASWQAHQVPLPEGLSIRDLIFRFAAKSGIRGSEALSRGVIALARLDSKDRWPTVLMQDSLDAERKAYEQAYAKVRELTLAGDFDVDALLKMDHAIDALKARVNSTVPTERGFRSTAGKYVDDLKDATRFFDAQTIDYAREIIADTSEHDAHTVGELVAFMQKYRLMFATAERSPATAEMYRTLFQLLQEQKKMLNVKDDFEDDAALPEGTTWADDAGVLTLHVLDREGETFVGRLHVGKSVIREIRGTVKGDRVEWLAKNAKVVQGDKDNRGHDNRGTLVGDVLTVAFTSPDKKSSGTYVLRRK